MSLWKTVRRWLQANVCSSRLAGSVNDPAQRELPGSRSQPMKEAVSMSDSTTSSPIVCSTGETVSSYPAYLQTHHWGQLKKRKAWFSHSCCLCGETQRIELHHLNYDRIGHERNEDVRWLCRECHQQVHDGTIPSEIIADDIVRCDTLEQVVAYKLEARARG